MSVKIKPGVVLDRLAPAGYVIVDAIRQAAIDVNLELTITCGQEDHPATDPHSTGEAIDVRSHDLNEHQKVDVLVAIMDLLGTWQGEPVHTIGANQLATPRFFGQLEHHGEANEHFHFQRRQNTKYTISDLLA